MSMTLLTILQIIWVSAAYLAATLLLPWLLLRRRLAQLRLPARFMAYCIAGNFFCINLVFLLQLLHISNRATLIASTLVPFLAVAVKHRKRLLALLESGTDGMGSLSEGELGVKTLALRVFKRLRGYPSGWLARWVAPRWLDVFLTAVVILLVLVMYGFNTVSVYGYGASDMVVYNHWINSMDNNQIFVDGVYPFGFHCILYYLHEVFAIPTYVLLRVFSLTQTLMVHIMLLAFLKLVCKSKYAPYVGVIAYITAGAFYELAYLKYYAAVPEEYGIIFILPAAYFAIAFLQDRDFTHVGSRWRTGGPSGYFLMLFSASVALMLGIHYYDAFAAGLLCIGIGVGYWFQCMRWRYLKRLLLAGTAGIVAGLLPIAVAFAVGIPPQSSLYWGISVISASDALTISTTCTLGTVKDVFTLVSIGVLLVLGVLWFILRRWDYAGVLVAFGVFMALLCMLQGAPERGLPSIIEASRCTVFVGYGLAVVWSLCTDAAAHLLFRERRAIDFAGLAGLGVVCAAVALTGVRTPMCVNAFESNGAMVCLTNILQENRDNTSWTICSANDERSMVWEYGYHYEIIDLLRSQEGLTGDTALTIPTDTVYFFIEKVPIIYSDLPDTVNSEREVSTEGAEQPLPLGTGIEPYQGDARWVTMSHMYYWAQAFQKLYPNELEVYYETDDFVCYRIRQDGYNLYNFAIDYGYNAES